MEMFLNILFAFRWPQSATPLDRSSGRSRGGTCHDASGPIQHFGQVEPTIEAVLELTKMADDLALVDGFERVYDVVTAITMIDELFAQEFDGQSYSGMTRQGLLSPER